MDNAASGDRRCDMTGCLITWTHNESLHSVRHPRTGATIPEILATVRPGPAPDDSAEKAFEAHAVRHYGNPPECNEVCFHAGFRRGVEQEREAAYKEIAHQEFQNEKLLERNESLRAKLAASEQEAARLRAVLRDAEGEIVDALRREGSLRGWSNVGIGTVRGFIRLALSGRGSKEG